MAYTDFEISNQDGEPIALYEFKYGNTVWRYCTSDADEVVGTDPETERPLIWKAHAITDEGVVQGGSDQNDLQVIIQSDLPVVSLFRNSRPSGKIWLTVRRWHRGDPETDTPIQWIGTVVNAVLQNEATAQLACRSLGGTYDRQGLRLAWGRMCPHVLYSFGCNANNENPKEEHAYPRVVAIVTGDSFTCTEHSEPAEGTFTGGFVEWFRPDGSEDRRAIEVQTGNHFVVLGTTDGLFPGAEVTLYPGCARNTAACKRFNNLPNYGGFPHLPGKSPFDGSPVF